MMDNPQKDMLTLINIARDGGASEAMVMNSKWKIVIVVR